MENGTRVSGQTNGVLVLSTVDQNSRLTISAESSLSTLDEQWCLSIVGTSCQATSLSAGANGTNATFFYYDLLRESIFESPIGGFSGIGGVESFQTAPASVTSVDSPLSRSISLSSLNQDIWVTRSSVAFAGASIYGVGNSTEQFSATPLTHGLVGYWPLDEGTGNIAFDVSGNSNVAHLQGRFAWSGSGGCVSRYCLTLDGSTGYGIIQPSQALAISDEFTVSLRFNTRISASSSINSALISSRQPVDTTFDLALIAGTNPLGFAGLHGDVGDGHGTWLSTGLSYPFVFSSETWYNVVVVVTPLGWGIYVNGREASSGYFEGHPTLATLGSTLEIGNGAGSPSTFSGAIDDVRVYNRALSSAEISLLYMSELPSLEQSATIPGSKWITTYYRQFAFRAGYSTRGLTDSINPALNFISLGQHYSQNLTVASSIYWLDAGTSWTASNTQLDLKTGRQWMSEGPLTEGTIYRPMVVVFVYDPLPNNSLVNTLQALQYSGLAAIATLGTFAGLVVKKRRRSRQRQ